MKTGEWDAARAAVIGMAERMADATKKAARQEAHHFRAMVLKAFNTRGKSNGKAWPKLKPGTIRQKGSTKPLIATGQLRNAVEVVEKGDTIFVGIASNKTRAGGGSLVSIAAVHEYGKIIAQRRGGRIVLIRIPQRSFIEATMKFHFKPDQVRDRFAQRVGAIMGPRWVGKVSSANFFANLGKAAAKGSK